MKSDPPKPRLGLAGWAIGAFAATLIAAAAPARAETPVLDLPIDCRVGETCWLVNLVDRDPGPGRTDFRCGPLSYDGHMGTDIAIASTAEMRRGVAVLAAAPGRVVWMRDGMPATGITGYPDGQACGNGVMIDHGDGWSTQYCHMKSGTVAASQGLAVARGQWLGEVGLSGRTEFPHAHITVRRNQTVIDPFTGSSQAAACDANAGAVGLWSESARTALAYPGPQPFHLGFADRRPSLDDVRAGRLQATRFSSAAPVLAFWVEIFTLQTEDRVRVSLRDAEGGTVGEKIVPIGDDTQLRSIVVWDKRPPRGWPKGDYTGRVEVTRDGRIVATRQLKATVE